MAIEPLSVVGVVWSTFYLLVIGSQTFFLKASSQYRWNLCLEELGIFFPSTKITAFLSSLVVLENFQQPMVPVRLTCSIWRSNAYHYNCDVFLFFYTQWLSDPLVISWSTISLRQLFFSCRWFCNFKNKLFCGNPLRKCNGSLLTAFDLFEVSFLKLKTNLCFSWYHMTSLSLHFRRFPTNPWR